MHEVPPSFIQWLVHAVNAEMVTRPSWYGGRGAARQRLTFSSGVHPSHPVAPTDRPLFVVVVTVVVSIVIVVNGRFSVFWGRLSHSSPRATAVAWWRGMELNGLRAITIFAIHSMTCRSEQLSSLVVYTPHDEASSGRNNVSFAQAGAP